MGILLRMATIAGSLFRGASAGRGGTAIAARAGGIGGIARTAAGVGAGIIGGDIIGDVLGFGDGGVPRRRRRRKALTNDDVKLALTIASAISKKAAENFILTRTRSA